MCGGGGVIQRRGADSIGRPITLVDTLAQFDV